jgi:hypothetical protein
MHIIRLYLSFLFIVNSNSVAEYHKFHCRVPNSEKYNTNSTFLIFSKEHGEQGLGNDLVYFPAFYFVAVMTGRDIVINNNSPVGHLCKVIHCGFIMKSQLIHHFPILLSKYKKDFTIKDVTKHFQYLNLTLFDNPVLESNHFQSHLSGWILKFNESKSCITQLSGCMIGDINCAEQYAFQQLIKGPFNTSLVPLLYDRVKGIDVNILGAILNNPYIQLPRFDAAIHIRLQSKSLERNTHSTNSNISYFDSPTGELILNYYRDSLNTYLFSNTTNWNNRITNSYTSNRTKPIIYVSVDDSKEKLILIEKMRNITFFHQPIDICYIHNNKHITHTKYWKHDDEKDEEHLHNSILDTIYDWYSLSLSNIIYAYRHKVNNLDMTSTFALSASRSLPTDIVTDGISKLWALVAIKGSTTKMHFLRPWSWPPVKNSYEIKS